MELSVAEKIRLILGRSNMTLGELAAATGQTRQNLSNKLNRENFSEKDIEAMAKATGCSVRIIFTLPDGTEI